MSPMEIARGRKGVAMRGWRASIASILIVGCASPALSESWAGRYVYEHDAGRTVGGTGIVTTYVLTLSRGRCRLRASGFQTDETIVCTPKVGRGEIDILFRSYDDGRTVNRYGVPVYLPLEPLVSLRRADGRLITRWRRYSPEDEYPAPGRYFRKTTAHAGSETHIP